MSSDPRFEPLSLNWTPATPTLSDALAVTVTDDPDTVEPFVGDVMDTVGAVVSPAGGGGGGGVEPPVDGLNATTIVAQVPEATVKSASSVVVPETTLDSIAILALAFSSRFE